MKQKSLLDTDIFSEILKGKNIKVITKAIAYKAIFKNYTISVITVSEIVISKYPFAMLTNFPKIIAEILNNLAKKDYLCKMITIF